MEAKEKIRQQGVWYGGAVSGLLGGLVMALILMIHSAIIGNGFFSPLKTIAATFLGPDAMAGGFATGTLGFVLHMVASAILGVIFAFMVNEKTSGGIAFFGGLVFGLVLWALTTYVLLPAANPLMLSAARQNPGIWFFSWLVFGGVLASTPYFERATGPKYFRPSGSPA